MSAVVARVSTALQGRYRVERALGEGGWRLRAARRRDSHGKGIVVADSYQRFANARGDQMQLDARVQAYSDRLRRNETQRHATGSKASLPT